ncbi:3-hydroxyacyl-[acyl-carrier-protein] dehydratase FabZ [bacterium HR40]|nr:3-hydroxyacyl-[acyl-carrier-protein] dehydratase FabZ [bacterium HR40]
MPETPIAPGTPLPDCDIAAIMRLIPHRYPFLLIDRVIEITAFERAVGIKNVTANEPFFPGHFPTDPIMPGVLTIEAMAQTAAVLTIASAGPAVAGSRVYFMAIDEARFRRPVRPGDTLRLEVRQVRSKLGVYRYEGRAWVGAEVVTEASFGAKLIGH